MTTGEQDKAGMMPQTPAPIDARPAYAVEVLDRTNQIVRVWHCRLEEPLVDYTVRIRPLKG
jgi:hypothetical protein